VRWLIATLFFHTFIITDPEIERLLARIVPDVQNVVVMDLEISNIKRYILKIESDVCHTHELLTQVWLEYAPGVEFLRSQKSSRLAAVLIRFKFGGVSNTNQEKVKNY
jgi:hypothetical protein